MPPRLRFAPSPTGNLHLGGARTALFNFLHARHTGGQFLLRIEDTDQERSTLESREAILEGMAWLGMVADEPPVIQSTRQDEHVRLVHQLLESGHAYRCTCTPAEVDAMREKAQADGKKPRYDGTCRDKGIGPDPGVPFTVRLRMPQEGETTIEDLVLGRITVRHEELDDLILLRSDGTPTYNFVVVCDDGHMGITHVVRGQDHMSNTFRQYHIYKALGLEVPTFAHLPLIDGLSKRKGSASVLEYRAMGYLPEAILNYIARLGWSHGDQELFTPEELISLFDLADVNKSSGKFDPVKLAWVNQQWIRRMPTETLAERMLPYLEERGFAATLDEHLIALTASLQERSNTLLEIADGMAFAFRAPESYDPSAVKKWMKPGVAEAYDAMLNAFEAADTWEPSALEAIVKGIAESHGLGMGKVAQPLRVALTGTSISPPIDQTLALVGREETLARLRAARSLLNE